MPTEEIRIDDALWGTANQARRREWQTLLADVPIAELWPDHTCRTVVVRCDETTFGFALYMVDGTAERLELPRSEIEAVLTEYLGVISRLEDDGLTATRAEALDMAKRVVHDDAARKLGASIPHIGAGLRPCRKLFSLLVSLAADTTKLSAAHRHL